MALSAGLLFGQSALAADAPALRFATEEWPPFFSHTLPDNGLTGALLDSVLERMGYSVQIQYYPWKRAMKVGLEDPRYAGAVAMFRTPEREKLCYFSDPVGSRQTVLAFLSDKPVSAAALKDLRGMRLGVVDGYSYGAQFDELVRSGVLTVENAANDEMNLRKLLHSRFQAIVIERRVLGYLLASTRFQPGDHERIVVTDQLFIERSVHVCFQRTEQGLHLQQAFHAAQRGLDLAKVEREYWRRLGVGMLAVARP
ncbi:transporter substrate-binding domain-containing protein [Duganella sp. FT80W]|uniref:Transporter substrate-binding domain-containing protein n=2 Tax=Duganella guangzhouensis TaxID=2666084 RepID=A0A6I2L0Q8_9BURK|nr:transporter substrate-binding domain-containing protein [Duganella guangzhouensis]